jgi:hypothetical protein
MPHRYRGARGPFSLAVKALSKRRTKAITPRDAHDHPQQVFLQEEQIRRLIDKTVEQRRETVRYNRSLTAGRTTSMPVGLFKW